MRAPVETARDVEVHAKVTFTVNSEKLAALRQRAHDIDMNDEMGAGIMAADVPVLYTLPQALQVVWHCDPKWLIDNSVLSGWTINHALDAAGEYQSIWGHEPTEADLEQWLAEP